MEKLYRELGTNRKQGLKMLYALERAGLLSLLSRAGRDTLNNLVTPDSYLAVDDIEIGRGNRIPLWMFGLLY